MSRISPNSPNERIIQLPKKTTSSGRKDQWTAVRTIEKMSTTGKSDQKAVSQMFKYPIFYNDQRQVADFPVIWKGAFKPAQRTCLAKQKPVKDTHEGKVSYSAFCGHLVYSFGKDDAGWKLTDIDEND